MFIKIVAGLYLLITPALYGAAKEDPLSSVTTDIIEIPSPLRIVGTACFERGRLALRTDLNPNDQPTCTIVFAYSEHAVLQTVLDDIVGSLIDPVTFDYKEFQSRCTAATNKHFKLLPGDASSRYTFCEHSSYNLIALRMRLDTEKLQYVGCYQNQDGIGSATAGAYPLWLCRYNGLLPACALIKTYFPLLTDDQCDANPKTTAEQLLAESTRTQEPYPFSMIIDLAAWRAGVESARQVAE